MTPARDAARALPRVDGGVGSTNSLGKWCNAPEPLKGDIYVHEPEDLRKSVILSTAQSPKIVKDPGPAAWQNWWMGRPWIEERLKELGKSKSGLAAALGLGSARVTELLKGTRHIKAHEIEPMASYLDWPRDTVVAKESGATLREVELAPMEVIGRVQAGLWQEAWEWEPAERYRAPVARDRRYPDYEQFGLEISGPSMNRRYPPGSVVVCVKFMDLGRDPVPGERVVVIRRSDLGFEATIKRLSRADDSTYWLWPESDDPRFQEPWQVPVVDTPWEDTNEDVRIVALVIGSYTPEG